MRIITGSLKGRRLRLPASFPARPTTDFARTGLFNVLSNLMDFEGARLLNLYSGSGIIAFEFISRGGKIAMCVDLNPLTTRFIQSECDRLRVYHKIYPLCRPVPVYLKQATQEFDLIFADPPFNEANYPQLLKEIFSSDAVGPHTLVVLEHPGEDFTAHPAHFDSRRYGRVHFSFFKKPVKN
ncbi:MAG: RsmD family RNA methyltransferase [Flavobacteriales bacterium]|nr:RsmD family RNA methyltransferase [Flavobacteriales bacterium]MCX7650002.1 RsmD family RNA methyltransferase [Flavobacteriales bacterium]MDW8432017.1 RsmD family RNA methyltransferase [Flavobacteriales bacterium]